MAFTPAISNVDLTAQNATIGATNLMASAPAGLYRISYYLHTTAAGSAGTVLLTLAWNDGVAQSFATTALTLAAVVAGTLNSGNIVIKSASGQAITYATTVAGVIGNPTYALGVRIERIN
jgi:hypothetical protein